MGDETRSSHARTEPAAAAAWRQALLTRAGFDDALASELAAERAVDLHALLELVDRGCPPELAARILAPIADRRARD